MTTTVAGRARAGDPRRSVARTRARLASLLLAVAATLALGTAGPASATSYSAAAWGYNASGQLGNGSTAISREPAPVAALSGVTAVAAGGEHSLALLADGTVTAWGGNRSGQLGNGSTTSSRTPVAVAGLSGVTAIAAGRQYSLALLSNGTVMAWGSNEEGQLGVGSTKPLKSTTPVAVKGLSGVTTIAAGAGFAVARLSSGTAMAWGAGEEGQLGNGKTAKSTVPVAVKGLSGVTAVAAGGEHALALLASGTVKSWGSNLALQLGMAPTTKVVKEEGEEYVEVLEEPENSDVPVAVQALSGVTAVAAGAQHSLALLGSGEVMAWGANADDQLGSGAAGGPSGLPTAVQGLGGVSAIAAGANHTLALLSGGSVLAWGYDPDGQLGAGANTNSPIPVAVAGLSGVIGIAGGAFHSVSFGAPVAAVSAVSPTIGPEQGGTSVTITGSNLGEATAVRFGANAAATFAVSSPSSITATAPVGAGVVDVTVRTPASTSAKNAGDVFSYVPPPTIAAISPKTGPAAGATSVTIKGASLAGATSVSFAGAGAAGFTVNSATSITAVSPPATSGSVAISVTTPFGTSAATAGDIFKYAAPTISGLSPNAGPHEGGTTVTVLGTGFAPGVGATMFKFGATQASSVSCESTTSCTFVTPAKKPGIYDVAAVAGGLKSKASPPSDQFTFQ